MEQISYLDACSSVGVLLVVIFVCLDFQLSSLQKCFNLKVLKQICTGIIALLSGLGEPHTCLVYLHGADRVEVIFIATTSVLF